MDPNEFSSAQTEAHDSSQDVDASSQCDDLSLDGLPCTERASTEGTKRERKLIYKVILQPRLSESNPTTAIPQKYLELFEKLQPKIIAQGLASENESLLTLNSSLRPKVSAGKRKSSAGGEAQTPLRVLGGRRMPPEAFAMERQMAPWSVRAKREPALKPHIDGQPDPSKTSQINTYKTSFGLPADVRKRLSHISLGGKAVLERNPFSTESVERRMSFGGLTKSSLWLEGSSDRPQSAIVRSLSVDTEPSVDIQKFSKAPLHNILSSSSAYRAYSQQVVNNARKLESFAPDIRPTQVGNHTMNGWAARRLRHVRSISLDCCNVPSDHVDPFSTPSSATSVFTSPPCFSHATSPTPSEDEEMFLRKSLLLRGDRRFGSVQELGKFESSVDSLVPGETVPMPMMPSKTESVEQTFENSSETELRLDNKFSTDAENCTSSSDYVASPGIEALFRNISRYSTEEEEVEPLTEEQTAAFLRDTITDTSLQDIDVSRNKVDDDMDLQASCCAETEMTKRKEADDTVGKYELEMEMPDWNCFQDGGTGDVKITQGQSNIFSISPLEETDTFSDDWNHLMEGEEVQMQEELVSKFISKVTLLLKRPNEGKENDQLSLESQKRRIKQVPISQLRAIHN